MGRLAFRCGGEVIVCRDLVRHGGGGLPRVSDSADVSIEFKRKSRIDRASRNEIAKFPIREFEAFSVLSDANSLAQSIINQASCAFT